MSVETAPAAAKPRPMVPVACNSCGARDRETVAIIPADYEHIGLLPDAYTRRPFHIARCRRCALVYLDPRPDSSEIMRYYPPEGYVCYAQFPPQGRLMSALYGLMLAVKRRQLLPKLPEKGVLLDFGCGNGHWLKGLKDGGLPSQRFVGVDPCRDPVEKLRASGVEAHVADERGLWGIVSAGSVDIILLIHVIEHVPDPKALLKLLAEVLRPGGEIHGVTPNVDALDRRLFGPYWSGWHPPRHFVLFDRPALLRYAEEAGLELIRCDSLMEGASHWAVSLHTLIVEKLWALKPGQYRLPIYPLLLLLAVGVAFVQKLFGKTSVMSFVLRRPFQHMALVTPVQRASAR